MNAHKVILFALLLTVFLQGCQPARMASAPALDVATLPATSTPEPTVTKEVAPLPSPTVPPTATEVLPTSQPSVTITAAGGNLYIRRGPGMEYDRIGLLEKGASANVIGQDVLSKWVQVSLPASGQIGWVSIMTDLTQVDGDLSQVPDFTFTDWAQPAYVKNCTEHDLYIMPGEIYLYNLFTNARYLNEAQLNPGVYTVQDLFLPDEPVIQTIDVREGATIYLVVDGDGTKHNCP